MLVRRFQGGYESRPLATPQTPNPGNAAGLGPAILHGNDKTLLRVDSSRVFGIRNVLIREVRRTACGFLRLQTTRAEATSLPQGWAPAQLGWVKDWKNHRRSDEVMVNCRLSISSSAPVGRISAVEPTEQPEQGGEQWSGG